MNRSAYVVRCTVQCCQELARYKIAAEWSDGSVHELKTYGLACENHLEVLFRRSLEKHQKCRQADGETLSAPQVFRIESGRRDPELVRLTDLEHRLS